MEKKATTKKSSEHKREAPAKKSVTHKEKYFFSVGRRKTAQARVKLFAEGTGEITVNSRPLQSYFPTLSQQKLATDPLVVLGLEKKVRATVSALGGGVTAQAKAVSLGLARALLLIDPAYRTVLKKGGFLSRDARKKERKKPGLKRARRAPQWQKR